MARLPYVSTYFSPKRGSADVVIGFIDRCEESIDAAVYAITHDGIADALLRAHARGVKVRVLMDYQMSTSQYADDEKLEAAGVSVLRDTQPGLMHHKFMVGDGKAVATGSFNWTNGADQKNAENFIITRLSYVISSFEEEFERIWALNSPTPADG
jgi:phosphatidylserine/phosphatidylglycerophosphate/cardiolipin synthase-like enzyme